MKPALKFYEPFIMNMYNENSHLPVDY